MAINSIGKVSPTIAILLALTACTTQVRQPDLERLFAVSSGEFFQNPVVVIPGAFGSKLRRRADQEVIWPGSLMKVLFADYKDVLVEFHPTTLEPLFSETEAFGLIDKFAGRDYYAGILDTLEKIGGYRRGHPGTPTDLTNRRFYVFTYDWRRDMARLAADLDTLIEQIRFDYGVPDLRVDIVAHSMGALMTRYYVRYGGVDVLDDDRPRVTGAGAEKIRKVVMLGAPNLGSISGLQSFMKGYTVGFGKMSQEVLATMPSAYQLMPHPDRDWMIDPQGAMFRRDLYSADTWREYRWSIFDSRTRLRIRRRFKKETQAEEYLVALERYFENQLQRAKRFHRALSTPVPDIAVRYVVFGGDCELTPARCLVENVNGENHVRLWPHDVVNRVPGIDYHKLMLEPGDGRVTKPSLLARNALDPSVPGKDSDVFPLAFSMFLCENHAQLTGNISFQDNLLNVLLLQGTTADRLGEQATEGGHKHSIGR